MRKILLKKALCVFMVLVLCLCFAACGGDEAPADNTEMPDNAPSSQKPSGNDTQYEAPDEPTYYYSAVEGAVIIEQDGSNRYVYCYKCEKCGDVQSNMKHTKYGGGVGTSYYCTDCKQTQRVEIRETVNW